MVKTEKLCVDNFEDDAKSLTLNKVQKSETKTRVTRNPFINFLMEFRRSAGVVGKELVSRAAEKWRAMDASEKAPYCDMAKNAPRRRRRTAKPYTRKKQRRRR